MVVTVSPAVKSLFTQKSSPRTFKFSLQPSPAAHRLTSEGWGQQRRVFSPGCSGVPQQQISIKQELSQAPLMVPAVGGHRHPAENGWWVGRWGDLGDLWVIASVLVFPARPLLMTSLGSAPQANALPVQPPPLAPPPPAPPAIAPPTDLHVGEELQQPWSLSSSVVEADLGASSVMMRLFVHSLPSLTFNSTYLTAPVGRFIIRGGGAGVLSQPPPLSLPYPNTAFLRVKAG